MRPSVRGSHTFTCRLLVIVALLGIAGVSAARAQSFGDDTFNDADWTSIVLPCSTPTSSVTTSQDFGQGNPAASRLVVHHYPGGNPGVFVAHVRKSSSYDPSTQGAITGITYSYDLRHYTGPEQWGVAYSPLIVQNGRYYKLARWDGIYPDSWQRFGGTNVSASDFVNMCGPATDHPDFSCNGSRMDFGFASGNSNPSDGAPMQDRSSGIDNWYMAIVPAQNALVVDALPDNVICAGDSVTLTAQGGVSYHWSPSAGLSCVDCDAPKAAPAVTTTYFVDAIYSTGCRMRDSITVQVNPVRAAMRTELRLCAGGGAVLPCEAGVSYRWMPSVGLDCDTCRNPTAQPTATTLYTVAVDNGGCFTVDTVGVTVSPLPTVKATGAALLCQGESTTLSASGGSVYRWSPAAGLSCTDCDSPSARPDVTTMYHVRVTDANGCSAEDSVLVQVKPSASLTVRVARTLLARPGGTVRFPVLLEGQPSPGTIDRFDFSIRYAPDILRADSILLTGTLCDGWTIGNLVHDRVAGVTTMQLTAPPGAWLAGPGTLMEIAMTAYVGAANASELPVTFVPVTTSCLNGSTQPGLVRLDSICGISYRLIEWIKGSYALDGNHPNPFNPTTTITFSLGLDGPTTLDVYNSAGRRVATLIDTYLEAGRYEVVWDASSHPSGVYWYQIRSGAWSRRASMVLMK